jgi:hypothetical protein
MAKIENFKVKNEQRGSATRLATFSVDLGPIALNGFELVRTGEGVTFISEPHRRYQTQSGEWKRFSYVWFNQGKGEQIRGEILELAKAEFERRANDQQQDSEDRRSSSSRGGTYTQSPAGYQGDDFGDDPF